MGIVLILIPSQEKQLKVMAKFIYKYINIKS